jgi:hypothetical protein
MKLGRADRSPGLNEKLQASLSIHLKNLRFYSGGVNGLHSNLHTNEAFVRFSGPPAGKEMNFRYPAKRRMTKDAFWPPKPKLVETATFTGISRAVLGT